MVGVWKPARTLAGTRYTIKHGPFKKFDMDDPMTMVYPVQDPAMLKTVKPGDKVKFDADSYQRSDHGYKDPEGQVIGTRCVPDRHDLPNRNPRHERAAKLHGSTDEHRCA